MVKKILKKISQKSLTKVQKSQRLKREREASFG